ncbi:DUF1311 domain-containing protein [Rhodobacter sphaeroides]|uniref:lysozyme inhibitor LprI family protein n=1 Tax=Cereibacter sphaeroides TaxID=1063 RepID=UPI001326B7FF|nr:lysozyme inhibitor LprI family protein [Cereibacter sphaeroides]MWP39793.1 DUF1311 domain-containing protein [Cereibacter sphaeroides]
MRLWLSFSLTVAATSAAAQASFDCSRASTMVEHAICSDPALAALDRDVAKAYGAARAGQPPAVRDQFLAEQRAWLAARDGCGDDPACLSTAMQNRLSALHASSRLAAPPSDGFTGLYCSEGAVMGMQLVGSSLRFDFMVFSGMHSCGTPILTGQRIGAGWTAVDGACRLHVTVEGQDIVVRTDTPAACKEAYCGARATIDEFHMPYSARRPVADPFIGGAGERSC